MLVGHGLGGTIAAAYALEHPERVRGLVLLETTLRPTASDEERRRTLAELDRDYPRALRRLFAASGSDSAQGARLYVEAAHIDPLVLKPWLRLELFADISLRMRHLKAPLLAIMSERMWPQDRSWEAVASPLGYSNAPNAKAVRLERAGRFLMLDRPDELSRLIERFSEDPVRGPIASQYGSARTIHGTADVMPSLRPRHNGAGPAGV